MTKIEKDLKGLLQAEANRMNELITSLFGKQVKVCIMIDGLEQSEIDKLNEGEIVSEEDNTIYWHGLISGNCVVRLDSKDYPLPY